MAEVVSVAGHEDGAVHHPTEGVAHDLTVRLTGQLQQGVQAFQRLQHDYRAHEDRWPLTEGPHDRNQRGDALTMGRVPDARRGQALEALDQALAALQSRWATAPHAR